MKLDTFISRIWEFYNKNKRDLLWRRDTRPYYVYVSEIMLQQTQVSRVEQKFPAFVSKFPDLLSLASSSLKDVMTQWQGLGYNRRAKYLYNGAQIVQNKHSGYIPKDPIILETLPGIGPATAGSIACFAYNIPTVFIETNIRRVFIHHFFPNKQTVSDTEIFPIIKKTLDLKNPREWYWALMDYGSDLPKRIGKNPNKKSKTYTKQSAFEGSRRQVRGLIIKTLIDGTVPIDHLNDVIKKDLSTIYTVVDDLVKEGLVVREGVNVRLKDK